MPDLRWFIALNHFNVGIEEIPRMIELAGIIILGISAQWLAWRIRIPSILPLILLGLLVGPISTLFTADGQKLISPIYDDQSGSGLFPGESLFYFVSLAIGIILFEGGLTLKRQEIRDVGPVIVKLITIGSLVTLIGGGLAAHFLMGISWQISFLFAGLIIVTGPTVIAPILQNIPLSRNVSTVLKWEGILIDPIGALVAVLMFEFIRSVEGTFEFTSIAFSTFIEIILIGLALGGISGYALYQIIKRELVPHYLLNVFTLAFVLCVFVFSDLLAHESGLLSVVVMGTVLGNLGVPRLKEILSFKESLSVLLISILFILLAANIDMHDLELITNNWRPFALLGFVAFILRPLGVFLSTRNSELRFNEKAFISWVGPRGIVAAGIASLFGITLTREGVVDAEYITPLVFMIVLGTVTLNATTARLAARLLKVTQDASNGVLIVGASNISRAIARYLKNLGRHVVLIDNNAGNVDRARNDGLEAFEANIYREDLEDQYELLDMGYILALTSNVEVNQSALNKLSAVFGEHGAYRLLSSDELKKPIADLPEDHIFSYFDDFINFSEAVREFPQIIEVPVADKEDFLESLDRSKQQKYQVPLFLKEPNDNLLAIPKDPSKLDFSATGDYHLVYLGEPMVADSPEKEDLEQVDA